MGLSIIITNPALGGLLLLCTFMFLDYFYFHDGNGMIMFAEAGKSGKRMMALLALSMLQKNKKVIIPFPIPMPVK